MNGYSMITAASAARSGSGLHRFFPAKRRRRGFRLALRGLMRKKLLDMLGLERKEKVMLHCVLPSALRPRILRHLRTEMHIDAPNNGIAYFISLECIGRCIGA